MGDRDVVALDTGVAERIGGLYSEGVSAIGHVVEIQRSTVVGTAAGGGNRLAVQQQADRRDAALIAGADTYAAAAREHGTIGQRRSIERDVSKNRPLGIRRNRGMGQRDTATQLCISSGDIHRDHLDGVDAICTGGIVPVVGIGRRCFGGNQLVVQVNFYTSNA